MDCRLNLKLEFTPVRCSKYTNPITDTSCRVLYQGVRGFVNRFLHKGFLPIAVMIELLIYLPSSGRSRMYLESLFRRTLEPVISNFDLQRYATYIMQRYSQRSNCGIRHNSGQGEKETHNIRAGPIKAFYERVCVYEEGTPSRLLKKIQTQASELTQEQLKDFLMPSLEELITLVDNSSSEVQECFQSLVAIYITRLVCKEPKRPSDWARLEEVTSKCYMTCGCCAKMNEFLMDPEARTHRIACKRHVEFKVQLSFL